MKHFHFPELTSTNDEAAKAHYPHFAVITADYQSAGRGQRGNRWQSAPGENLMFSLVVEPRHIPASEQFRLSMMAALAACDAIKGSRIKWSNDIYIGDKKVGGILIEHSIVGDVLARTVIGIGINVNQLEFPAELPNPTSLKLQGVETTPAKVLKSFEKHFKKRYKQSTARLHADYIKSLWRADVLAPYSAAGEQFWATIGAVNPLTGQLTLVTENGAERHFWFKEVEFLLEVEELRS